MFILGSDWELAGEFSRWMMLWVGVGFMNSPAMMSLLVHGKQKINLTYDFVLLIFRILILFFGGLYLSALNTIIMFSILGVIFNLGIIIFMKLKLTNDNLFIE